MGTWRAVRVSLSPAFLVLALLALAFLVQAGAAQTQDDEAVPRPIGTHVNDFVNLLDDEQNHAITKAFADLRRDHDIDAIIVTLNKVRSDYTLDDAARRIGWLWHVDRGRSTRWIIMLVLAEGRVQISVGEAFSDDAQQVIEETLGLMITTAQRENLAAALVTGAQTIARRMPSMIEDAGDEDR